MWAPAGSETMCRGGVLCARRGRIEGLAGLAMSRWRVARPSPKPMEAMPADRPESRIEGLSETIGNGDFHGRKAVEKTGI